MTARGSPSFLRAHLSFQLAELHSHPILVDTTMQLCDPFPLNAMNTLFASLFVALASYTVAALCTVPALTYNLVLISVLTIVSSFSQLGAPFPPITLHSLCTPFPPNTSLLLCNPFLLRTASLCRLVTSASLPFFPYAYSAL